MQLMLHRSTESICGCCGMLSATAHRGFHAAHRGDRVSVVGSPHRPALSRPAKRRTPCVRPGLGEKGYIMAPWPLLLPCSSQLFHHKKMSGMEFFFFKFHPQIFLFCSRVLALGSRSWRTQHPVLSRNTSALSATPSKSICQPNTVIH